MPAREGRPPRFRFRGRRASLAAMHAIEPSRHARKVKGDRWFCNRRMPPPGGRRPCEDRLEAVILVGRFRK